MADSGVNLSNLAEKRLNFDLNSAVCYFEKDWGVSMMSMTMHFRIACMATAIFLISLASTTFPEPALSEELRAGIILMRDDCQPLSASNLDRCCNASNVGKLLSRSQRDLCPPPVTAAIGGEAVDIDAANTVAADGVTAGENAGNEDGLTAEGEAAVGSDDAGSDNGIAGEDIAAIDVENPHSRVILMRDDCQPLSLSNLDRCCSASNVHKLLSRAQRGLCPPLDTAAIGNDDDPGNDGDPTGDDTTGDDTTGDDTTGDDTTGDDTTGDDTTGDDTTGDDTTGDDTTGDDTTGDDTGLGNPGNSRDVGRAGETPAGDGWNEPDGGPGSQGRSDG